MKTLYCIIGNLRAGQAPVDSFKKHVLNENTDVALYVGDDYHNSQWRDISKYTWETNESTNWWEQVYDDKLPGWRDWDLKGNIYGPYQKKNGRSGSGMIICGYRELLHKKLLSIPRYDRYVLSRSDIMFTNNILPEALPNTIYVPEGEGYGGVTDRFIVGDRDSFLKSLLVLDTLKAMKSQHPNNVERLLLEHFQKNGLKVNEMPRFTLSIGRIDEQTRWMAPSQEYPISEYEGYFAKYPNEYVLAMKNIKQKK